MTFTLFGDYVPKDPHKDKGPIKVYKEKRNGSIVTIIKNLPLDEKKLKELLSDIKKKLASGGSIKEEELIIQGDKVEEIKAFLKKLNYKVS